MKTFKPTHFDETVNVSKVHPLKEFATYLGKGVAILVIAYLCIGFTLEFFVMRMRRVYRLYFISMVIHMGRLAFLK